MVRQPIEAPAPEVIVHEEDIDGRSLIAVALLVFMVNNSFAGIYERIEHQQRRIHEGVRRGQLTHEEARILRHNLNHIRHAYDGAVADGRLTPHEARRFERMLDRNDEMIYQKKHNAIRRFY